MHAALALLLALQGTPTPNATLPSTTPAPAPAIGPALTPATALGAASISDARADEVMILRAQLAAQRDFQDAVLDTVFWSLGTVAGVALLLVGYSWFSNRQVYTRDRDALRGELLAAAKAEQASIHDALQRELAAATAALSKSVESAIAAKVDARVQPLEGRIESARDEISELAYSSLLAEARYWETAKKVPSNALRSYRDLLDFSLRHDKEIGYRKSLEGVRDALKAGATVFISDAASLSELMSQLPAGYSQEAELVGDLLKAAPRY